MRCATLLLAAVALIACARASSGTSPPAHADAADASAPPGDAAPALAEPSGAIGFGRVGRGDGGEVRTRVHRVAAMGDSLTDANAKGGAFLELLHERCPRSRFDNFGVGGQMVNQMAARFARQILGEGAEAGAAPEYTDVIVWGGVNDLYSDETAGRTVAQIEADLARMYAAARARGVRVLALTVAPWGGFERFWSPRRRLTTLALNAWIREAPARGSADVVVDAWALLSCGDPDKLCPDFARRDGLHVTTSGQRRLGAELARHFADCE